jgi:hypothetical protein
MRYRVGRRERQWLQYEQQQQWLQQVEQQRPDLQDLEEAASSSTSYMIVSLP